VVVVVVVLVLVVVVVLVLTLMTLAFIEQEDEALLQEVPRRCFMSDTPNDLGLGLTIIVL
jgi:hypothetical protein